MVLRRLGGLKPGTALAVVGEPALLIYNAGFLASRAATASRLVWQVTLAAGEDFRPTFFLSASDGSLVAWDDGVREIDRAIYDCSDFVGDLTCYLNLDGSNHIYGRSEGLPPRGPNPFNAPFAGSTDVDKLYDLAGEIHNYYAVKFGRNGGNGQGGTGNGVGVPISQTRFVAHANRVCRRLDVETLFRRCLPMVFSLETSSSRYSSSVTIHRIGGTPCEPWCQWQRDLQSAPRWGRISINCLNDSNVLWERGR